nr:hemerythrin domain-containing protein [Rhodococcus pyridinivorans]
MAADPPSGSRPPRVVDDGFLHHHHWSEDRGLYPRVVQCNPDAAPLVERMNADHRTIEPAIAPVEEAARDLRADRPGSGEHSVQHCPACPRFCSPTSNVRSGR